MKLSTKVDILDKRGEISLKKKELANEMTDLLIISNDSYDPAIKKKIELLEAQDTILSWVLDEILLEKIDE
jgi:hypothetical protein